MGSRCPCDRAWVARAVTVVVSDAVYRLHDEGAVTLPPHQPPKPTDTGRLTYRRALPGARPTEPRRRGPGHVIAQEAKLRQLVAAGFTVRQIGPALGASASSVSRACGELGIDLKTRHRKTPDRTETA